MAPITSREEADRTPEGCSQGFWTLKVATNEVDSRVVSASPGMWLTPTGLVDMAVASLDLWW